MASWPSRAGAEAFPARTPAPLSWEQQSGLQACCHIGTVQPQKQAVKLGQISSKIKKKKKKTYARTAEFVTPT